MGFGCVFSCYESFNFDLLNKDWEERKIQEFMEQENLIKNRNEYK
jgi:hypothetical protein